MKKIPDCDRCLDFREDTGAEPEELWEPEGASYYNGELILQPKRKLTLEDMKGQMQSIQKVNQPFSGLSAIDAIKGQMSFIQDLGKTIRDF